MLEELFKKNKLEYVHIETNKYKNIILNMTLNKNIENLRYFNIDTKSTRYEITLDVTQRFPNNLAVYNV